MSEIKALVPVMTSNTEPSGVVEYSSLWTSSGNYKGYYAFDNDDSTYWASSTNSANQWISYEFPEKKLVKQIFIDAGNQGSSGDTYKLQYYNGTEWVDLFDYRTYGNGVSETYSFGNNVYAKKYRVIFGGSSTHNTRTIQLYGLDEVKHLHSAGNPEAIRDWFNASLYNKEEIDNLFIQNNQPGLIPYDLTIQGYEPEQMVKLVGQTSGKVYNLCLAALMGEDMKETVLWTNSGSTNPSTITLSDDWTKYKFLMVLAKQNSTTYNLYWFISNIYPTSRLKELINNSVSIGIAIPSSDGYVDYAINLTTTLTYKTHDKLIIDSIIGYS